MASTPILPQIGRYQASLTDPDLATAETIRIMCEHIDRAALDEAVQQAAIDAVKIFRGGNFAVAAGEDPTTPKNIAISAWWYAKHRLKFEHHEKMIRVLFGESGQLQLLISPEILVRLSHPRGDCAIYVLLICAILRCWNVPYEIVTAACDPTEPGIFSHVFVYAVMPDGTRFPLDASHGAYPGWQVPFNHRTRTQVRDADGNPVEDHPMYSGLGAYLQPDRGYRPRLGARSGRGFSGWRRGGLGQDFGDDDLIEEGLTPPDTSPPSTLSLPTAGGSYQYNPMTGTSTWVATPTEAAGSTPSGFTIGTAGPGGSVLSASGAPGVSPLSEIAGILTGAASSAVSAYNQSQLTAAQAASIASWTPVLMIGGLVLAGLVVLSLVKK